LPDLRHRWQRYADELAHPAVELTAEEFAPILATFKLLRGLGEPFDPTFAALMLVLEAQAIDGDDDVDAEYDDPDEDRDDLLSFDVTEPAEVAL
jgi:hypothetical protein